MLGFDQILLRVKSRPLLKSKSASHLCTCTALLVYRTMGVGLKLRSNSVFVRLLQKTGSMHPYNLYIVRIRKIGGIETFVTHNITAD